MSVVDSEAVFSARCAKVGLSETAIAALREKGWGTHANFAFSTAVIPGQGDDSVFVRDVITAVLGLISSQWLKGLLRGYGGYGGYGHGR
ncbi:hypothetical protein AK812_SmicGene28905 [Symbiodinium microadriaticum]|uniref:Uncharacterized protein n=1 Tax=Symbiodinium microadriaticum TaxID=2951 RepID=A0A1Q9D358_SYMMI|nr:hypothetical protein AK812_SmicGene28905 [Symbiodinium microadriaticum]